MFIRVLWQCSSYTTNRVLCGCLFVSFGSAPVILLMSSVWMFIRVLWQCSSYTAHRVLLMFIRVLWQCSSYTAHEFCVDVYSCPLAVLQLYISLSSVLMFTQVLMGEWNERTQVLVIGME